MIASATKYMVSSGPSCFSPLTASNTKREFSFVYPFFASIWSRLGENMRCGLSMLSTKGKPLTSQNPVQRAAAQSKSISQGNPFSFARRRAEMTSLRQGDCQYFSLARLAIARYCSGWASRHAFAAAAPFAGSARYFAAFSALRVSRSSRANQSWRALCHFMACGWLQKRVCLPTRAAPHVRQAFCGMFSMIGMYAQNDILARS